MQDLVNLGGWWHPQRRFIKVVYQNWIEDCVAEGRVLDLAEYRAVRWEWGEGPNPSGPGWHAQVQIR